MPELDVILQPAEYRPTAAPPAWAFFPRLRLLLGWGEGVWETFGDQMSRIRTLFVIVEPERQIDPASVEGFLEWISQHDRDRPPMPFYARLLRRGKCACSLLHANDICMTYAGPPAHALNGPEAHHPIEANEHFRVAHGLHADGSLYLTIERRATSFKPTFQAKMADLTINDIWTPVIRFDQNGITRL